MDLNEVVFNFIESWKHRNEFVREGSLVWVKVWSIPSPSLTTWKTLYIPKLTTQKSEILGLNILHQGNYLDYKEYQNHKKQIFKDDQ